MIERADLVRLDSRSLEELARLCQECTEFFELVHGEPGGPSTAKEILGPAPAHVTSGRKHVFGVYVKGEMAGVAELLEGYPGPAEWYVGLLVLRPNRRANGLGSSIWTALHEWIRDRDGSVVRLIVQKQNARARRFWERHGFEVEGETVARSAGVESPTWMLRFLIKRAAHSD